MPDEKDKQTRKRKKRPAPVSYRPPESLREEFLLRVEKSGLSTCAFLTRAVFEEAASRQSRRPALEAKLLAKLLQEATKIHGDLQKLAGAEDAASRAQLEEATEALIEIRAALLVGLGRNP